VSRVLARLDTLDKKIDDLLRGLAK
jgi:hypothetical protein